jgi:hypothetical protein
LRRRDFTWSHTCVVSSRASSPFVGEREQPQAFLEIPEGRRVVVQVIRQQAAVAQFGKRRRRQHQQRVGHRVGLRERAVLHVEAFQVHEHPHEDLPARGAGQQVGVEGRLLVVAGEVGAAIQLGQDRAVVERVHDEAGAAVGAGGRVPHAHQEMTGKLMPSPAGRRAGPRPCRRSPS